jgi:hypothetical protein
MTKMTLRGVAPALARKKRRRRKASVDESWTRF